MCTRTCNTCACEHTHTHTHAHAHAHDFRLSSKQLSALYHDDHKDGVLRGKLDINVRTKSSSHFPYLFPFPLCVYIAWFVYKILSYCFALSLVVMLPCVAVQMALCRTYHKYSIDGVAATAER